jgi:hypothetical protein
VFNVQGHLHLEQDWNGRLRDKALDIDRKELHNSDGPAGVQGNLGGREVKGADLIESGKSTLVNA